MKITGLSKVLTIVSAIAISSTTVPAQEQNAIFTVRVNDLNYTVPESRHSAGEVIGTIFEAIAGEATNTDNSRLAPAVSSMVRSAFTGVRRLASLAEGQEAQFDISGDITSIVTHTSTRAVDRREGTLIVNSYEASIGLTLTMTEIATGQQWTNSFSSNTLWYEDPLSETEAFDIALNRLNDEIVKAYNIMFPLVARIVEGGEVSGNKQKSVYIDLGEANGIYNGLHFEVFELSTVAGRETRRRLGKLKVEETMGDEISKCKVEKGAKEIKSALDEGKTLLVTSID